MSREDLAADILKELIRCPNYKYHTIEEYAKDSVAFTDALLSALSPKQETPNEQKS